MCSSSVLLQKKFGKEPPGFRTESGPYYKRHLGTGGGPSDTMTTTSRNWTWIALIVDRLESVNSKEPTHLAEERIHARGDNHKNDHRSSGMDSYPGTSTQSISAAP